MQVQQQIKTQMLMLLQKENMSPRDFSTLDRIISLLGAERKKGNLSASDISAINQSFGEEFLAETIQGYGLRKPFGYAGDFLMIDKIYTFHTSCHPKMKIWDEYFHQKEAPKAVRNRKEYFKNWIESKARKNPNLSLLNLASGPARDLYEMYASVPHCQQIETTCVEMDKHAISYAKNLNRAYLQQIEFIQKNIFKYQATQKYDLIWSAGLFDYFSDENFVRILQRIKKCLKPGGEMVVGNFNEDHNPSRDYMEIFGEWFLHHRTAQNLTRLAEAAGFSNSQISIGKEKEQVNLFLHLNLD